MSERHGRDNSPLTHPLFVALIFPIAVAVVTLAIQPWFQGRLEKADAKSQMNETATKDGGRALATLPPPTSIRSDPFVKMRMAKSGRMIPDRFPRVGRGIKYEILPSDTAGKKILLYPSDELLADEGLSMEEVTENYVFYKEIGDFDQKVVIWPQGDRTRQFVFSYNNHSERWADKGTLELC